MIEIINHQIIDKQVCANRNKNLYSNKIDNILKLEDSTSDLFKYILTLTVDQQSKYINYTVDRVINEFCNTNQYYYFDSVSKAKLSHIYSDLLY